MIIIVLTGNPGCPGGPGSPSRPAGPTNSEMFPPNTPGLPEEK